ncbi:MAG: UDP-3-O-acyl-N-acetylglucosamine deacetylase [Cyanobacteria bacterium J06649_5]
MGLQAGQKTSGQKTSGQKTSGQKTLGQKTLAAIATAKGVGLHLGQPTTVRLLPADPGQGRYFVRTDMDSGDELGRSPQIAAAVEQVIQTQLSTELGASPDEGADGSSDSSSRSPSDSSSQSATVRTVEHLLSALVALEIDNVRIEIDGPELPLLDGSAKEWIAAIAQAGTTEQSASRKTRLALTTPVSVQSDDAWVSAFPCSELRFSYGIDFELAAIGNQWHSWSPTDDDFACEVAPARTFGLAHQIDYLRSQGLIKGGSLDNALVCGADGWVNPPLRFDNEPARHKLLDLIGDLSLLGDIPKGHYVAYKASHALHVALAKKLVAQCPFA